MTGFGAAEGELARGTLRIEIRTVNHRFFNVAPKLPTELQALETQVRERLRQEFDRGHIAVYAQWVGTAGSGARLSVDLEHARQVAECLHELQGALNLGGELDLALVARQQDVLVRTTPAAEPPEWTEIEPIVAAAARECRAMRQREGEALARDIAARLASLSSSADQIATLAPERLIRERDRLRANVRQLLDGQAADETRIAQEVAMAADRLDITEELVRLRAHLTAARVALDGPGAIGKQLGFVAQEMGREVNTIGSKANDAGIAQLVIGMKGELEKIREQVENLE